MRKSQAAQEASLERDIRDPPTDETPTLSVESTLCTWDLSTQGSPKVGPKDPPEGATRKLSGHQLWPMNSQDHVIKTESPFSAGKHNSAAETLKDDPQKDKGGEHDGASPGVNQAGKQQLMEGSDRIFDTTQV